MAVHMKNIDILMVGKTGSGKSALGNMILQKKAFTSRNQLESVTKNIQYDYSEFEGTGIKIVDGPGVCDTMEDKRKAVRLVVKAMSRAVTTNEEGFHAILLVMRYGCRYTEEDVKTITVLQDIFGETFLTNHSILVMTCGDLFEKDAEENDNETFKNWCQGQGGSFAKLLGEVKNRVILIDNKAKGEACFQQIRHLLQMIEVLCSNGVFYTTTIFGKAKLSRDRLIVESKRSLLEAKAAREAELINQQLGSVRRGNSEKELGFLCCLKARAETFEQTVIEQDKGTNALTVTINVAKNLIKRITHNLEEVENTIKLRKEAEELERKMKEAEQKRLLEEERRKERRKEVEKIRREEEAKRKELQKEIEVLKKAQATKIRELQKEKEIIRREEKDQRRREREDERRREEKRTHEREQEDRRRDEECRKRDKDERKLIALVKIRNEEQRLEGLRLYEVGRQKEKWEPEKREDEEKQICMETRLKELNEEYKKMKGEETPRNPFPDISTIFGTNKSLFKNLFK